MILVCRVISQDDVIKGSCDFMWLLWLLDSFEANIIKSIKHSGSEDIMVLVCRLTLQDYVVKVSYDFISSSPSRWATILQSLVAIATSQFGGRGVIIFLIFLMKSQDHLIKG